MCCIVYVAELKNFYDWLAEDIKIYYIMRVERRRCFAFIGTREYLGDKEERSPKPDLAITVAQNEAFLLTAPSLRASFKKGMRIQRRNITMASRILNCSIEDTTAY